MIQDQASELREWVARVQPAPEPPRARFLTPCLAVSSGKGGVGKTNLSVNLAIHFSRQGRRVLLLDADLGLANADVLCDLNVRFNLAHVVTGRRSLAEAVVEAPGGFWMVPGASGLAEMAGLGETERQRLLDELALMEDQYDLLIIDTGAGIGAGVLGFLQAADQRLIVTTPEPTAMADAYALIKLLFRRGVPGPVSLAVNMAQDRGEARQVYERIAAVCRRFLGEAPRDAGGVVWDASVGRAVRRRQPLLVAEPKSPASLCIQELANKLELDASDRRERGFFGRVLSWFGG